MMMVLSVAYKKDYLIKRPVFFVIAHKLYINIKEICRNRNILSKPSTKSNLDFGESNDFRDSVRLRHVNCKTIHSLGFRISRTDQ